VSAPTKYDQEFRDRAVRMYRDRLAEPGESKLGACRHVGSLLDVNQATLRNWIEERYTDGARLGAGRGADSDEVRTLKKRVASLSGANEILKTDERWKTWFDDMTVDVESGGVTVLRGPVADQAALHGLLARLRDLGVHLRHTRHQRRHRRPGG
jgi:transposase-like protein